MVEEFPSVILVMGVCGCGKSLIGSNLAKKLAYDFIDADCFHPESNKSKMAAGTPLTDEDRLPWLKIVRDKARASVSKNRSVVVACSALKDSYRQILRDIPEASFKIVFLSGKYETLKERLNDRKGHFFNPKLLDSQLATLELPEGAITVAIEKNVDVIVAEIIHNLK